MSVFVGGAPGVDGDWRVDDCLRVIASSVNDLGSVDVAIKSPLVSRSVCWTVV